MIDLLHNGAEVVELSLGNQPLSRQLLDDCELDKEMTQKLEKAIMRSSSIRVLSLSISISPPNR